MIKPSEDTPLTALAAAELGARAGVPAGVVNMVTGSRENAAAIGTALATSPLVKKLSFTGSTPVGKILMAQCASTVKRTSMELGGNAPFIVFDDADLDAAVAGVMAAKFRNAGQTCVCANRIYVQAGVYDTFAAMFAEKVSAFQIGHGLDDGTVIGPLINAGGVEKSTSHVNDAVAKGATVLTGGGPLPEVGANFFAPTVLTGIDSTMLVHSEETFGPVAPLFVFESEEEVIAEVRRCCCSVELTQCSSFQISCRECAGFSSTCFFLQVIVFLAPLSIFNSFCLCVCAWVLFLFFFSSSLLGFYLFWYSGVETLDEALS